MLLRSYGAQGGGKKGTGCVGDAVVRFSSLRLNAVSVYIMQLWTKREVRNM